MIRCKACNIYYTGETIVFVELKYVLPKEISKNSDFADINLVISANKKNKAYIIISYLYKSNTQIRQKRQLSLYQKVDFTIFWLINIVGCQLYLIFAYSIQL